jgi:integrase
VDRNNNPIPKNLWPKRRKHSWEVRWYGSDRKRYSKSFKIRKEATEYAKKVQSNVDKGKGDKLRNITLSSFIAEHEKVMNDQVAYTTLKDQLRALQMFAEHVGYQIPLVRINPRHAESFVAARLSQERAVATVNKDIRTLKGIFNFAIELRQYLPEGTNPFASIRTRKTTLKPPYYVPIEDFQRVLVKANNVWWHAFLVLAYTSAARKNELLNLTWSDIDFEEYQITIHPKRASDLTLSWGPKDHERRIIPIPPETIQILANLQTQADEKGSHVFVGAKRLAHVLYRRSVGEWTPKSELVNNVLTCLKRFCRNGKVKEFSIHDLRRICITNLGSEAAHPNRQGTGRSFKYRDHSEVLFVGAEDRHDDGTGNSVRTYDLIDELLTNSG